MKSNQPFKIYWIINHPTHYHVHLVNEVSKVDGLEIRVYSYRKTTSSHPWSKVFPSEVEIKYLDSSWLLKIRLVLAALFSGKNTSFLVAGWNNVFYLVLINILRLRHRPLIVWTDTPRAKTSLNKPFFKLKNRWLKYVFSSKSSYLFVTGARGVEIAEGTWQIKSTRVVNFPFVTNHEFFKPQLKSSDITAREIVFLSSGRIDLDHKGYDIAIAAFKLVRDRGIDNFKYRIAGTGPDLPKLKELIDEAGLTDHVELCGWVEFDELPTFYNSGHILLHPSNEDPFPNAVLEAMSCGLPIIGSDKAGSVLDRVEPGENGYIFKAGDYKELAEIVIKTIREKDSIATQGRNATSTALRWDPAFNIRQLERVVESL